MAQLISVRIDVSKIDKERLYKGEKGTYLDVTVSVNDEPDKYGKNVSVYQEQTKEERENKAPKNFLGSGKVIWTGTSGGRAPAPSPAQTAQPAANSWGATPAPTLGTGSDDDLPF